MKIRHHLIPQFYLKRFTSPNVPGQIWEYDRETSDARPSNVEGTAFEKHLYSFIQKDGQYNAAMEDWISEVETKAAPILAKYLNAGEIEGQERADLSSFFALMFVRTNSNRRIYAENFLALGQLRAYAIAKNDEAFETHIKKFEESNGILPEGLKKKLRDFMIDPSGFELSLSRPWTLKALEYHDELAPIFYDMNWTLLHAPENRYFITSDNPVVKYLPEQYRTFHGGGFKSPQIEVTLPLSNNHCWFGHWNENYPHNSFISVPKIKHVNRLCAIHAERFLFASKLDKGIKSLAEKYKDIKTGMKISGFGPEKYSPVKLKRK